ncbi:Sensors of blue-light using FAD [Hymenobacter mucosus]|uniref:Sensors of blue-light using FAD n=2 Tax=Hymenobacteraceae TaxID=1853232 RepID=A0A238VLL4_9BACT|nr:Sensors of blue-light using FAD [Hymenobacter mucosus]
MSLYQITYTSVATQQLSEAQLAALLEQARSKNEAQRISGLLLYSQQRIIQVLEGEETAVRTIYEVIQQDPRHTQVETLMAGPVARRSFPDWSMGFASVSPQDFAPLVGYINPQRRHFLLPRAHNTSPELLQLLEDFVASQPTSH